MIYLDSCLIIYAIQDEGERGDTVRDLMGSQPRELAISPLVKMECLVQPIRQGNPVLQRYYEQGLAEFTLLPMTDSVFTRAAEIRGRSGLKTPDALHLATAQIHGCDALWTNDDRLAGAGHGLAIGILHSL